MLDAAYWTNETSANFNGKMRAAKELFHAVNDFLALFRRIYSILFEQLSIVFEYRLALLSHERSFRNRISHFRFLFFSLLIWFLIGIFILFNTILLIINLRMRLWFFLCCEIPRNACTTKTRIFKPKVFCALWKKLVIGKSVLLNDLWIQMIWKYRFSHFLCTHWFIFQHFVESHINKYIVKIDSDGNMNRICLILVNLLTLYAYI